MDIDTAKKHLNNTVIYRDASYMLTGLLLRRSDKTGLYQTTGQLYYSAELRDIRAGYSLVIARLEEVEEEKCHY